MRVENGVITDELNLLVQPPKNYYWSRFIDIHGITPADTIYSPSFEGVWSKIKQFIEDQIVVAHNGFIFDFPVLAKTLEYYDLAVPVYESVVLIAFIGIT